MGTGTLSIEVGEKEQRQARTRYQTGQAAKGPASRRQRHGGDQGDRQDEDPDRQHGQQGEQVAGPGQEPSGEEQPVTLVAGDSHGTSPYRSCHHDCRSNLSSSRSAQESNPEPEGLGFGDHGHVDVGVRGAVRSVDLTYDDLAHRGHQGLQSSSRHDLSIAGSPRRAESAAPHPGGVLQGGQAVVPMRHVVAEPCCRSGAGP